MRILIIAIALLFATTVYATDKMNVDLSGYRACTTAQLPAVLQAYDDIASANGLIKMGISISENGNQVTGVYFYYRKEGVNESARTAVINAFMNAATNYNFIRIGMKEEYYTE